MKLKRHVSMITMKKVYFCICQNGYCDHANSDGSCGHQKASEYAECPIDHEEEHAPYCDCEECRAGHMEDTSEAERERKGLGVTQ